MKMPHVMWFALIGIAAAVFYIAGCSNDAGTSANTDNCYQTSDSPMVCGDTNFQLY